MDGPFHDLHQAVGIETGLDGDEGCAAIATLDERFEAGDVEEEAYKQQRAALIARAQTEG